MLFPRVVSGRCPGARRGPSGAQSDAAGSAPADARCLRRYRCARAGGGDAEARGRDAPLPGLRRDRTRVGALVPAVRGAAGVMAGPLGQPPPPGVPGRAAQRDDSESADGSDDDHVR